MNDLSRNLRLVVIYGIVSAFLILSACGTGTLPPTLTPAGMLLSTPVQAGALCAACDQATLVVALTQAQNNSNNQAAATAELVRANAQATLNSANSTLSAAQTQDQNNANVIAAQIAATAEIARANAQATIYSAGSTQSAALTLDAIRQTQIADLATTGAQSLLIQQYKDNLAASTQTAIANNIATQTQVGVATSQGYIALARQREEQRHGFIAFLWMLWFPILIFLLAVLILWAFGRWLRIQQNNQRILENPVDRWRAPVVQVIEAQADNLVPYIESDVLDDGGYHPAPPDNQMRRWLDEVKRKLRSSDKQDEDDNTDN